MADGERSAEEREAARREREAARRAQTGVFNQQEADPALVADQPQPDGGHAPFMDWSEDDPATATTTRITSMTTTRPGFTRATTPAWARRPGRPRRAPAGSAAWTSAASGPHKARTVRRRPPHSRRRGRWRGRIAALIALILAGALIWFLVELFQPLGTSPHGNVTVVIPPKLEHQGDRRPAPARRRHRPRLLLRAAGDAGRRARGPAVRHLPPPARHELRVGARRAVKGPQGRADDPADDHRGPHARLRGRAAAQAEDQGQLPGRHPPLAAARPPHLRGPAQRPVARGLPLPRHLHPGQAGEGLGAGRRPAQGLQAPLRRGQPRLRPLQAPVALRRAHGGLADRGRGGLGEGTAAHRLGHLQPPGRPHDAPVRHHHPVRHRQLHQAADRLPAEVELALQHPHPFRAAADPDRQPRPGVDRGGRPPGPHARTCTSSPSRARTRPCSPPATRSSSTCWPSTGAPTAANDRRGAGSASWAGRSPTAARRRSRTRRWPPPACATGAISSCPWPPSCSPRPFRPSPAPGSPAPT